MPSKQEVVLLLIRTKNLFQQYNQYFGFKSDSKYQIFPLFYNSKKIIYVELHCNSEQELIIEFLLQNTLIEGKLIQIYIVSDYTNTYDQLNKLHWLQLQPQLHQITQYVFINKNWIQNHNENILYFQNIEELLIKIGQLQQNQQQIIYKQDFIFNQDKSLHQQKLIEQLYHIEQEIETYNQLKDIPTLLNKIIYVRQNLFYEVAAKIKPSNHQLLIQYQDSLELKFNLDVLDQLQQTTLQIINQINKLIKQFQKFFVYCPTCCELKFLIQQTFCCFNYNQAYSFQKPQNLEFNQLITNLTQSKCNHAQVKSLSIVKQQLDEQVAQIKNIYNYQDIIQNLKDIYNQQNLAIKNDQIYIRIKVINCFYYIKIKIDCNLNQITSLFLEKQNLVKQQSLINYVKIRKQIIQQKMD